MYTGYLAEGETMEDDYDVSRNLLPEELLGIIDQLLCLEVRHIFLYCNVSGLKYPTDGVAHGAPALSDHLHQFIHR